MFVNLVLLYQRYEFALACSFVRAILERKVLRNWGCFELVISDDQINGRGLAMHADEGKFGRGAGIVLDGHAVLVFSYDTRKS